MSGPSEADLNRAIELSNLCIRAARGQGTAPPIPLSASDFLMISAALRTFAFTWGDALRRHEIADLLSGTPEEKMARTDTVELLEGLQALKEKPQ